MIPGTFFCSQPSGEALLGGLRKQRVMCLGTWLVNHLLQAKPPASTIAGRGKLARSLGDARRQHDFADVRT